MWLKTVIFIEYTFSFNILYKTRRGERSCEREISCVLRLCAHPVAYIYSNYQSFCWIVLCWIHVLIAAAVNVLKIQLSLVYYC